MASFKAIRYHLVTQADSAKVRRMTGSQQGKIFEIRAEWDDEAEVWWCSNDELPLTTEAPTFEQLVSRVLEIAPEIAAENGLAAPGDQIEVHVIAERVQSVPVVAAA
jgi:Domain of unknown function (DUF1902)